MADQVVGRKQLLGHLEMKIVQPTEQFHMVQPHRAFRVDVQPMGRQLLADEAQDLKIPAGAELQLNARIALLGRGGDRLEKRIDRVHPVEADSQFDPVTLAAKQLVKRTFF